MCKVVTSDQVRSTIPCRMSQSGRRPSGGSTRRSQDALCSHAAVLAQRIGTVIREIRYVVLPAGPLTTFSRVINHRMVSPCRSIDRTATPKVIEMRSWR